MVVISLPHASLLHPVALRRPPGPQQSSFISAKQTRDGNPTLPAANVLSGVSPARRIPQPTTNRKPRLAFMQQELTFPIFLGFPTPPNAKTPLRTSTAPSPGVAAHLLSGVSPSGTILRSFPGRNPAYRKCCQTPSPTANVLSGVSGSRRATGRCLTQKPRLASVKPCGCGAGGWRA